MKSCTRTVSWRRHCLSSTAFRVAVLKDLSCLICVTELPLVPGTFLLYLPGLLSSSSYELKNGEMTRNSVSQENWFITHPIADHHNFQEHIPGGLQSMAVKSAQEKALPPTVFLSVCFSPLCLYFVILGVIDTRPVRGGPFD